MMMNQRLSGFYNYISSTSSIRVIRVKMIIQEVLLARKKKQADWGHPVRVVRVNNT